MAYAQTGFYILGIAGLAGMFCIIVAGSMNIFGEILRIIVTGAILCVILPPILNMVLTAAFIAITWRMARRFLRKTKETTASAAEDITSAIASHPKIIELTEEKYYRKLEEKQKRQKRAQLEREIQIAEKMKRMGKTRTQ